MKDVFLETGSKKIRIFCLSPSECKVLIFNQLHGDKLWSKREVSLRTVPVGTCYTYSCRHYNLQPKVITYFKMALFCAKITENLKFYYLNEQLLESKSGDLKLLTFSCSLILIQILTHIYCVWATFHFTHKKCKYIFFSIFSFSPRQRMPLTLRRLFNGCFEWNATRLSSLVCISTKHSQRL